MNAIKDHFSIKDLENLSGIKAHTIRIWEKRYRLLSPKRTNTNIRFYTLKSLQKLLNVASLYNHGYKISKIAKIPENEIPVLVREIASISNNKGHSLNDIKMAMMNFDQALFYNAYNNLISEKSFRDVFFEVFIPFLNDLGILWQTDTISPAHEHFISNLIKQKIIANTEKLQQITPVYEEPVFVLFLPNNEVHEIGLLYINYEIMLRGYKSIYLGQSVPMEGLQNIAMHYSKVIFISYFTIAPSANDLASYIKNLNMCVNANTQHPIWVLGSQTKNADLSLFKNVSRFSRLDDVVKKLQGQF
ncbi:MerR family transcriptional regulator [Galbibacter pacificus]|uniref:MerR family transcriptional regulator n=1 Tax=Galbibacter pacificus TaxID=2996052 RepID=A0ABT6FVF1_9FLAO|nr:MerR family transcriptional regulator [Galbibacter pacificus]MDG3583842.1 MerR family transcriptional regulator [Galbibacter pacificus]MDG3587240.1 MerR family transcriptional regulator [Galbibacter pacificus]